MNLGGTNGGHVPIYPTTGTEHFQKPLMEMTIGEIRQLQRDGKLHVAGRYQFKGTTIDDVFERGNMPPEITNDSLFSPEVQDLLAVNYFRMTVQDYSGSDGASLMVLVTLDWSPNFLIRKLRIIKKIQNDPDTNPGFLL